MGPYHLHYKYVLSTLSYKVYTLMEGVNQTQVVCSQGIIDSKGLTSLPYLVASRG